MPLRHALPLLLPLMLYACAGPADVTPPGEPGTPPETVLPEARLSQAQLEADLRFLASDELMGRKAGTPGNDAAARYLAEQFRLAGAQPVGDGFMQPIPFSRTTPPRNGSLTLLGQTLEQGTDMLILGGGAFDAAAPVVYAGHGLSAEDYDGLDARGKIVVTQAGVPDQPGVQAAFRAFRPKQALAAAQGAVALVELYAGPYPWQNLTSFLAAPRFGLDEGADDAASDLPVAWVGDAEGTLLESIPTAQTAHFSTAGLVKEPATSNNVVAWIEGSDPALRDEYILLTAHYDHVGAGMRNGAGATPADSIFNGARDNGMGTVALLGAARALAQAPPRRSVLIIALTAEEDGLLGSRYYADHPLKPLDKAIFNLNIDGGGYSDTTAVTIVGMGRTTADPELVRAAADFGLVARDDPAPEQNFFDRSDNVNFARRGIPAPTFSPGFRAFTDPGIANYYHRPQDEADDLDYAYLKRFVQAYTRAARLVANRDERPFWTPGDTYEEAGQMLYGME